MLVCLSVSIFSGAFPFQSMKKKGRQFKMIFQQSTQQKQWVLIVLG